MENNTKGIRQLRIMVYLMGYTMIFGILFICYIIYHQNQALSKPNVSCDYYDLMANEKIIGGFWANNTLMLIGETNTGQHSIYKTTGCKGKLETIGKIVYE
jgi:heme/copper-type cytochrome/quinol oxidase subunit 3